MTFFRALSLHASVMGGYTNATQLQTILADPGFKSGYAALLTGRGVALQLAGSPEAMEAIVSSPAATDIIFRGATTATAAACQAVCASAIGMNATANSKSSLLVLAANTVSWDLYKASPHYGVHVRTTIAHYASVNPALYATADALVSDSMAMSDIAAAPYAVAALVASPETTTTVAANAASMALLAQNPVAIDIVAKQTSIMGIIAASTAAMTEIVSRATATSRMASYPGSITAISKVPAAWASYLAGPFFAANLPLALANLIGVSPAAYPTLASIIADSVALAKVAANTQAVAAMASNSAAMTTLADSPNIGVILSSATAMGVIGPNTSAMAGFLNSAGARPGLFASSVAKGYIASSTALVDVIAGSSSIITFLGPLSKVTPGPDVPDALAGVFQPFNGIPSKVLIIGVRGNHIAATFADYQLKGSPQAGSQAGAVLTLNATAASHVAAYTNMQWDLRAAAATPAGQIEIRYVDMT